jgi:hypothetical protein
LFYRGFCDIKDILDGWKSDDVTIKIMAFAMSKRFEKYWKKSNSALVVASFLDPRYKKKLIGLYMRKFYGDLYQLYVDVRASFEKNVPTLCYLNTYNINFKLF